jgi:hypothetical protein
MSLTYKGLPVKRVQFLWKNGWKESMYFVETAEMTCVVPFGSLRAEGGIEEITRIIERSRGRDMEGLL